MKTNFLKFFLLGLLFFSTLAFAQKKKQQENEPITLITVDNPIALNSIQNVALFINGTDQSYVAILQSAISIELKNMGWHIVNHLDIQQAISEDYKKYTKTKTDSSNYFLEQNKDKPTLAKLVGADYYLDMQILLGRRQYSIMYDKANLGTEKIVTTTISLEIIDATLKKPVVQVVFDMLHGEGISYIAKLVRDTIEKNITS